MHALIIVQIMLPCHPCIDMTKMLRHVRGYSENESTPDHYDGLPAFPVLDYPQGKFIS